MDSFTAGIALIVTQFCVALVMAGIYFATPREKCTRYWAISEILVACGTLIIIINAGTPSYAATFVGVNGVIWGAVLQLFGIQAFYKKLSGNAGWWIGAGISLIFGILLLHGASIASRVLFLSVIILLVLAVSFRELWSGPGGRRTFGNLLTLCSAGLLILNNIARIGTLLLHDVNALPMPHSSVGVALLYLMPLAGSLLYGLGLLLLYFERIVAEKHHLATHDELTGMLNRRAIVNAGEREVAIALRNRQALTLALVDIDYFKRVNDSLGHEAGDVLLIEIAQLLKTTCRNIDLVGRYGGEEFCIIFPNVPMESGATIGERLLSAVRQYRFRSAYQMTISIGFASLAETPHERSWTSLINRADAALYRAKNFGRDQFCIAEQE